MQIEQLPVERDRLGEGPFWDQRVGALYWLDHLGPIVRRFVPETGEVREWRLPKKGGCACLTDDENLLIVALADAFATLDLRNGRCEEFVAVPQPRPAIRLSDGRADRLGGFVVGSAVTDFAGQDGALYRLTPDRNVEILRDGMMLSNAICFGRDGGEMYFTDTRSAIVHKAGYSAAGPLQAVRPFADARSHGASPDGATVDSKGGLWVAQIRTGDIVRFAPDGKFDFKIQMPVPHVTSVAFGGANLDILYVTTVRETGMQIRSDHPLAGGLFAVRGLGFTGLPEGVFNWSGGSAARGA